MSRAACAIKMLILLKNRGLMSREELAMALPGETKRSILYLKEDLEHAGYEIETVRGKNGGYRLKNVMELPASSFTNEDTEALRNLYNTIRNDSSMINQEQYITALEKIMANLNGDLDDFYRVFESTHLSCGKEVLESNYCLLKRAIRENKFVEFTYTKTNGESKHVRVEPYFLVEYRNCWYLEALYNLEERYYKLNRISDINVSELCFRKDRNRVFSENSFNMKKVKVELRISNERNDIQEYVYSKDQKIIVNQDGTYTLKASMPEYSAYALIKNLGKDAVIIKPVDLRKKYLKEVQDIMKNYKKNK